MLLSPQNLLGIRFGQMEGSTKCVIVTFEATVRILFGQHWFLLTMNIIVLSSKQLLCLNLTELHSSYNIFMGVYMGFFEDALRTHDDPIITKTDVMQESQ